MGRAIGVFSGKGGVGKTITAVNTGLALQDRGTDVLCVDGDVNAPNIAVQLGIDPGRDGLTGDGALGDSIYIHESGLTFLPSAHTRDTMHLSPSKLRGIVDRVHATALVDAPPGFHRDVQALMTVVDRALVVSTPEAPSVQDAAKMVGQLEDRGVDVVGVVAAMAEPGEVERVADRCGADVLAAVPWTPAVRESIAAHEPLLAHRPYDRASLAYRELAAALAGETYEPPRFARVHRLRDRLGRVVR